MWKHSCVYTCVRMYRWLGAGLQCLQCVSHGDAAVLRRVMDIWVHSCMHANTCISMAGCGTAVSPVRLQWTKPSTCAFKHHHMCCTLRNNDHKFDILVVAGGTGAQQTRGLVFRTSAVGRHIWIHVPDVYSTWLNVWNCNCRYFKAHLNTSSRR